MLRRRLFWAICALLGAALLAAAARGVDVEQYGVFEIKLDGPAAGNPFTEVKLSATFTRGKETTEVPGFYDGDGVYRIRFMPRAPWEWRYQTHSNRPEL